MAELIDKSAAYKALKHEAETHMLPASREAYERSARIIDQMPTIETKPVRWISVNDSLPEKVEGKRFCSSFHAKLENEE